MNSHYCGREGVFRFHEKGGKEHVVVGLPLPALKGDQPR